MPALDKNIEEMIKNNENLGINDLYRKMNILANTAENLEEFIEKGK
jgi:hypothetical protein